MKLSNRKQLLSEADVELKRMQKLSRALNEDVTRLTEQPKEVYKVMDLVNGGVFGFVQATSPNEAWEKVKVAHKKHMGTPLGDDDKVDFSFKKSNSSNAAKFIQGLENKIRMAKKEINMFNDLYNR